MLQPAVHPEDVKAEIRKRFGTIENFAKIKGLKPTLVHDFLRGKSHTVSRIVADSIGLNPDQFVISRDSINLDGHSKAVSLAHRLNSAGK
ncbi:MAG: helix-turn-helix domain-containing protein [Blastomonas sp.]